LEGLPAAGAVRYLILEIVSQTAPCHSESRRLSRWVRNLLFNTDQTSLPTEFTAKPNPVIPTEAGLIAPATQFFETRII
jgi:hypothetical protein